MANPTYLVGVNPSAVPGGPLQQILVLTSDISGAGGGSSVSVNGTSVANPNFSAATPAGPGGFTNVIWQFDGSGNVSAYYATSGTTVPFGSVLAGTSTVALVVGTGGTLTVSGTGVIETTELATTGAAVNISNSAPPAHAGQLLISQPGNVTAVWADPFVQGLYPIGTAISTPINPVFIGASDGTDLQAILVDGSGNLKVAVENSVTVSGTVAVSGGTIAATQSGIWNIATITNPVSV